MPTRLTETSIASAARDVKATGRRRDLSDAGCPGLRLRLSPNGTMTWALACRDRLGRMRRFVVGDGKIMRLSDARDAARALRVKVRQDGADPVEEARKKRAIGKDAKAGIGTLAAVLNLYGEKTGQTSRSWPERKGRITSVFRAHLDKPASLLTASALQITADKHPSGQSAAAAVRYLRPVLKWAAQRNYAPREAALLTPPAAAQRRDRVLSEDELKALLPVLRASNRPHAAAMRFMLLTLARREEVGGARWQDIDFTTHTWTIPTTKNGQPHTVPLSHQAVSLLLDRKSARAKPTDFIFSASTGGRLLNWDRECRAIQEASETTGWTRHDLRRTGATQLGKLGVQPFVIEAALNHVSIHSQIAAIYNRSRYQPEVSAALQLLADWLDGLLTGGASVVPLRRVGTA